MLKIYKGEANRSHENTFFRLFSISLVSLFERNGMEGVLLGMPKSLIREDLQIDALLITNGTITIIDFKDYSGEVILPNEDLFKLRRWETSSGIQVKGGSSVNPFTQLAKQRHKLIQILERTLGREFRISKKNIATMVCFCNPVDIIGNIPASLKLSFFISNSNNFSNVILDIIDVVQTDVNLLEGEFLSHLRGRIFEAREYDLLFPMDKEASLKENILPLASEWTEELIVESGDETEQIAKFLNSESRVMVVTGVVGSCKDNIVSLIRDIAFEDGYQDVNILALSNRVKNNLLRSQEDVISVYSTIYDFSSNIENGELLSLKHVPLRKIDYYNDESYTPSKKETLFIVEESHMISDSYRDDPNIQFGSGKLLSDLIEYLKLTDNNCPNKIIFIGDKYQLSFGSWNESSLNSSVYGKWDLEATVLDLPDPENPNDIQEVCIQIADAIRNDDFSSLNINSVGNLLLVSKENEENIIRSTIETPSSKILVYTNKQARDINLYIKKKIVKNGNQLAIGDLVVFDNQINACTPETLIFDSRFPFDSKIQPFDFTEPKRVENGWFGEIIAIFDNDIIESDGDYKDDFDNSIKLRFVKTIIRIQEDGSIVVVYVLEDFLYSEKTKLGEAQEREYQIFLNKVITRYEEENPFEKSIHFKSMISDEKNYKINEKGQYRNPEDGRKLTKYEKEYQKELSSRLLRDSNTLYFKIYNAARIKFGWCLTVHRAMSYEWSNVSFSTECENRGRNNADFFKFIYTGISRAKHRVNLIRWKQITPFEDTQYGNATNVSRKKDFLLEGNGNVHDSSALLRNYLTQVLNDTKLKIVDTNSKNYQELITISDNEYKVAVLSFYYKGTGQIRYPSLSNGDEEIFNRIMNLLKASIPEKGIEINKSPLYKIYCDMQMVLHNAQIVLLKSDEFQDIIEISADNDIVLIQIYHTKDLMISNFNYCDGNKIVFDRIVQQIGEYYGIQRNN